MPAGRLVGYTAPNFSSRKRQSIARPRAEQILLTGLPSLAWSHRKSSLHQLEREESRHAIRGIPQIALQGNRTPKTKIWQIRLLVRALKPHDYASLTLFWQRASAFLFEHGGSALKRHLKVRQ
jgi:hypothetical protein